MCGYACAWLHILVLRNEISLSVKDLWSSVQLIQINSLDHRTPMCSCGCGKLRCASKRLQWHEVSSATVHTNLWGDDLSCLARECAAREVDNRAGHDHGQVDTCSHRSVDRCVHMLTHPPICPSVPPSHPATRASIFKGYQYPRSTEGR